MAKTSAGTEEDIRPRIAANVRRLREACGLSASELARKTGVDRARIGKIEAARITPGAALLLRLATALDTTAEKLAAK